MPELRIRIPDELEYRLEQSRPNYLDRKAFVCLLLASALDTGPKLPAYRVGAGTREPARDLQTESLGSLPLQHLDSEDEVATDSTSQPKPAVEVEKLAAQSLEQKKGGCGGKTIDLFARRQLDPSLIPSELLDCQQLLPEFWAVKKGTRSQQVFNRVCNKLRQWDSEQRREALERAIASGWGDVFEPPAKSPTGASTGYVDSITRDEIEREKFLSMFSAQEAA
jgi:hypothetical protein